LNGFTPERESEPVARSTGSSRSLPLLRLLEHRYPDLESEELYARILCGEVIVDGGVIRDPKLPVSSLAELRFSGFRPVSRGGEKLATALDAFPVLVKGKVFIDAGCSTGGFTQCLLERGASCVHAVDVGYNLLDYSLRNDPRVAVHERTNIMDFRDPDPVPQAAVADLSFRSIGGAAGHILDLTREGWMIALVKPQFEWKDPPPDFSGVVSRPEDRAQILARVAEILSGQGLGILGAVASAVPGRKGNQEYLFLLERRPGMTVSRLLDELSLPAV